MEKEELQDTNKYLQNRILELLIEKENLLMSINRLQSRLDESVPKEETTTQ